ncbi:alpha/beta fold hydrolase [Thalassoroseus pseudoceratinae]|uniref:alpha/beta fold hydrolase n=1 Tax=Thalassoroseus pseudoceratinae TaxID=2713176 RepID=UPI00142211AC|nr:alpha/beta fold hydrolase [Thalassoroseus pseudoceratinae]
MRNLLMSLLLLMLLPVVTLAETKKSDSLPKVVLIGDSIRLSYTANVRRLLDNKATVVSPKANGQDSANVLRNLDRWVIAEQPDIVHFNCGIHDTKKFKNDGHFQVSPEQYQSNLTKIIKRIREKTDATILFATTTPIIDDRAAKARRDRDYELLNASVEQYNKIARTAMKKLDVPVNDLHAAIDEAQTGVDSMIVADGVHLTEPGKELAGTQVANFITQYLPNDTQASTPWNIDAWKNVPEVTWLDRTSPIRSLTYRNEPFQGNQTDVFAFYATPGTISGDPSQDKNLPAVVLIHGGGGTAFAEWAWLWANRGYAAIAMDLSGRRPEAPTFDESTGELTSGHRVSRSRLENGGPEANHVAKFQNAGGDLTDDWQPHAVAAVMRAHSLIRSFPETDAERTAVTGISWGGYMTCLVASLDDRFKAAVPVYGCGFLFEGESVQKPQIDRLDDETKKFWIQNYDPSTVLSKCEVPILFVNGTNDIHYPLNSYQRSYDVVPGPKQIRIEAGMRHSHIHGWTPAEIGLFIDQHLRNAQPLPQLTDLQTDGQKVSAKIKSETEIRKVELVFTSDSGLLKSRKWQHRPATVDGDRVEASIPADATVWILTVTDVRDAMTSSSIQFAE